MFQSTDVANSVKIENEISVNNFIEGDNIDEYDNIYCSISTFRILFKIFAYAESTVSGIFQLLSLF